METITNTIILSKPYFLTETSESVYKENTFDSISRLEVVAEKNISNSEKLSGLKFSFYDGDKSLSANGLKIRQGIEITSYEEITSRPIPFITIGNGIAEKEKPYAMPIDHSYVQNSYGPHSDTIKESPYIAFVETDSYNPIRYVGETQNNTNLGMYIFQDNDHFRLRTSYEATLDPIGTRKLLFDLDRQKYSSVANRNYRDNGYYQGIHASFCGGKDRDDDHLNTLSKKNLEKRKGTVLIKDTISIRERVQSDSERELYINNGGDIFNDSAAVLRALDPNNSATIDSNENLGENLLPYFDDTVSYFNKYVEVTSKDSDLEAVFESIKSRVVQNSNIGSVEISMSAGWVYENTTIGNTTLGTDSLAFGGMNRRI